tara:strand:- start:16 stop:411 length:396 start_codon:yes stop_codon:yes gene_type:complete
MEDVFNWIVANGLTVLVIGIVIATFVKVNTHSAKLGKLDTIENEVRGAGGLLKAVGVIENDLKHLQKTATNIETDYKDLSKRLIEMGSMLQEIDKHIPRRVAAPTAPPAAPRPQSAPPPPERDEGQSEGES